MSFFTPTTSLLLAAAYLLGSIPFGLILAKLLAGSDIRKSGSGNIGATNVARVAGPAAGIFTLVLDAAKGMAAVWLAGQFTDQSSTAMTLAGVVALLGHCFPIWLKFKGGKGVATFIGVTTALYWPVGLLVAASWLLAALVWRISSLSALIAIALSPAYFYVLSRHEYAPVAALLAVLIFYTHRENIRRLLAGAEPRIGRAK